MNARQNREVKSFIERVETRIKQETELSHMAGLRVSARRAAAARAHQFTADLHYLRACYTRQVVMVGQGSAR
jgi:hypothetical protein